MDCLNTKEKCNAFSKLLEELKELNYAIDFSDGDDCAMGFNEKKNNLWIMLDCDYHIAMFINLDDADDDIQFCWTDFEDDNKEYIEDDFEEIFNIAHSHSQ
jgi:hypothetical protein